MTDDAKKQECTQPPSPYRDITVMIDSIPAKKPKERRKPPTKAQRRFRRCIVAALCIVQAPLMIGLLTDLSPGTHWPGLLLGCQILSGLFAGATFVGAPVWLDVDDTVES